MASEKEAVLSDGWVSMDHEYVRVSPSGSDDSLPSNVTVAPTSAV